MSDGKPKLLIAKGSFATMGGAERDLLRVIPYLKEHFELTVTTLVSVPELEKVCDTNGIALLTPAAPWKIPAGLFAALFDKVRKSARKAWKSCDGLEKALDEHQYIYLVSGDGYLGFIQNLPPNKRIHLQLHEPHRGLHEDSLHRTITGGFKRPWWMTSLILRKSRKNDQKIIRDFFYTENTSISGNSNFSAKRAHEVYDIDPSVLWPCVDFNEFSPNDDGSKNPVKNQFSEEYVVNVGTASWAKGVWEVISMLKGSGLSLAHVGGGAAKTLEKIKQHANRNNVPLWIAPRIPSNELAAIMRDARAVVSMAHKEPFGLTPIEAFAVGTPAIFVNEGGFQDTITDGICGRLIERENIEEWHRALQEAADPKKRANWAESGRNRIETMGLKPIDLANRIMQLLLN